MTTERIAGRSGRRGAFLLLAGCVLCGAGTAGAAPTPPPASRMLEYKPRQEGISYSTPAPEAVAKCKVEYIPGQGSAGGYLLRDESGQPLRLFFDTKGGGKIDAFAYYKDGVEVYREIDSKYSGKVDQFRWFNAGGMKWGVDATGDGRIKTWKAISPEEVSQELLQALIKKDAARLQALLITEDEIKGLQMPADMAARVRDGVKNAPARFQDASAKLTKLGPKTVWLHLETAAPQCLPADPAGGRADIVRHARGTVLVDVGNGNEWIQTGEMIKVGDAWRLTGGPTAGPNDVSVGVGDVPADPAVQKLIDELAALDKQATPSTGGPDAAAAAHHLKRADLLEKIQAAVKETEREPWVRQLADSLSTAAQSSPASDSRAYTRLASLEQQLVKAVPGHNLTAYVTFREMQAEYAAKLSQKNPDFNKVQSEWIGRLSKFVADYPKAEDTPDALLQLGMVSEFLSKDVEAKNWYGQLAKNFADKPQGAKAAGAIRRLDLEGQALKLSGPTMKDPKVAFDVEQLRGKIVVVYYWASWNTQCAADFAKLKAIIDANKGVEVVCVSLDSKLSDAQEYLRKTPAPGVQLYQEGGLEGKLATDYGVMVLPSLFLVNKDGKVASRSVQITNLEDEVKKLTK
jgi:hypothetical protein